MRALITFIILCSTYLVSPLYGSAELQDWATQTEDLWNTGEGDELSNTISTSMVAWGLALAVGIGVLAAVMHQSTAPSTTTQ